MKYLSPTQHAFLPLLVHGLNFLLTDDCSSHDEIRITNGVRNKTFFRRASLVSCAHEEKLDPKKLPALHLTTRKKFFSLEKDPI